MAAKGHKRIIAIAVDASEQAEHAFGWYVKYMHRPDNYVLCLHIPESVDVEKAQEAVKKGLTLSSSLERLYNNLTCVQERFEGKMKQLKINGKVLAVPSKVKSPGTMLVELIKEHRAFAVVMGTRGLSTVKKMLKGSVSDHVFDNAEVPVIVVRLQNE